MSFTLSTGNIVVAEASGAIVAQTDTTATLRVTTSAYITDGWVMSTGVVAIINLNGSTSTRTIFGNGNYYYAYEGVKYATYDVTVNKTTANQNINWSVQFWQYTDGVQQTQKQTNSGTITVKPKTSYSVIYNANGGTGAPAAQTKWYGTALTLSSTKPTRTGYTFSKWNTNESGTGTNYNSGASYSGNAALTLYAIWTANTYTITYNANGGTGAPSSQTKTYGVDLTLSSTKPTRTNYNFMGWATSSTASTATYSAGGKFTTNAATTLYAVWELAYTVPLITGYSASRCTSNGTLDDFGTYAKVIFNWECCQITGANNVTAITIGYRVAGSTAAYTNTTVSASGTNGSVSKVIGGSLSTDNAYDIQIAVTDTLKSSNSGKATRDIQIPMAQFILDFKKGGTGIAIGKPAQLDDTFEVAKKTIFTGGNDTSAATASSGMVLIGNPSGAHMALDTDEIQAKTNGTTVGELYLQNDGGNTIVGDQLKVNGKLYSNAGVVLPNDVSLYGKNANGTERSLAVTNVDNCSVFGNGGYAASEGQAYYEGNIVNIVSKNAVNITSPTAGLNRRAYGVNKVLWSGASFMHSGQYAGLSENISAQPHGILLVWSKYANNAAEDACWEISFIPKYFAVNHTGTAIMLPMAGSGFGINGSKCVYLNDTSIRGHDANSASGYDSYTGVAYTNFFWVLRYVIGV